MSGLSAQRVAAIHAAAAEAAPAVLAMTARIAAVAAPTGEEGARARFVATALDDAGLPATIDAIDDVVARLAGRESTAPPLLLAAHLDTVFVQGTPLPIRCEGDMMYGPGVGDNSVGIASVLAMPVILRAAGETPAADVLLTGNVGEEGLGNLRGIRAVLDANPNVGAVVAVEGHNLGRVTHVAVGSRRYRIEATGPGGHSWGDWGRPSALHALARLINDLDSIPLPRIPKTTLNVGVIEGGISVNSIAPSASCLLDLRSVDAAALARLADRVERVVASHDRGGVAFTATLLGERPAGVVPLDSPIVRRAAAILAALGIDASFDASSTDANVPIGRGIPAICVGLTTGGNVHREDEYIDTEPLVAGLTQLALLTLELADALATGTPLARPS
ncbi:MAG TPA: M20/M25/M40 family metallo-hydrolase [Thermomicrobiales bacterium]|nr:M20/M25/M40 family metallo-hydrolase [Thermomicrobiales bacterium]